MNSSENKDQDNNIVSKSPSATTINDKRKMVTPSGQSNNFFVEGVNKILSIMCWIFHDFSLKHLIWIKLIFFLQSGSMTVLYPYLNLHMKSLGISIEEAAIINALIPILFIFTPPLASFLQNRLNNFRVLLCILNGVGRMYEFITLNHSRRT